MLLILVILSAAYGLVIGSFLNVVIYRVPRDLSIVRPGSACPTCHASITWYDNIPVISWLVLRGRCRGCGDPISPRYILVELAGGAIFAGVAARLGYQWDTLVYLVFFSGLLALSYIDVEHLRLPTKIVYTTLVMVLGLLVLAAGLDNEWRRLAIAGVCAAVWFVLFFLLNFFAPRYLGFGDVRLSLVLGLGLGWLGVPYVVIGFYAAAAIGVLMSVVLMSVKRFTRDRPIPFGVYLSLGAALVFFAGPEFVPSLWNALHL